MTERDESHCEMALTTKLTANRAFEVLVRSMPCELDAETVYVAMYGDSEYAYWLDSNLQMAEVSRYSIMGDASGPLAHVVTASVADGTVTTHQQDSTSVQTEDIFEFISRNLSRFAVVPNEVPRPFALGYVGYLGYELKAQCGAKRQHQSPYPDAGLIFSDRALVFDHMERTVHALCLSDDRTTQASHAWLEATFQRLSLLVSASIPDPRKQPTQSQLHIHLRDKHDAYLPKIYSCKKAIERGDSYEICLTTQIDGEGRVEPLALYQKLRRQNPAPFGSFFRLGDLAVLSSSPERFLSLDRERILETRPIKGTAPRSTDPTTDAAIAEQLAADEKTRAENLMIVDLSRNDLGRCAKVGTVNVSKLFDVETYATVHQLVSTVRAKLRGDLSAVDAVRACFPGGSMTGAPKLRTMEIIDELEGAARGIYSGALGYFSLCGAMDLSMVIRTLVIHRDSFSIGTGGAIVAQSSPEGEFDEILLKAKGLLNALELNVAVR